MRTCWEVGVAGAPESPASYANEGFFMTNAFFWFLPEARAFFLCLKGKAKTGVAYEIMPNYGSQGQPSEYWSQARRAQLPAESAQWCNTFYPVPHTMGTSSQSRGGGAK